MPTTAPVFAESGSDPVAYPHAPEAPRDLPDRVRQLEDEVAELRDTIARFAHLVIGEVKVLRNSQTEPPALPARISEELPVTAVNPEHREKETTISTEPPPTRRPWLLAELLRDFATMVRMYLDPRYRVRRSTQLLVPIIAAAFAFNFILLSYVPILNSILEKLADLILGILLYKVLNRELVRYRQVIAQLLEWQAYRGKYNTTQIVSSEPAMSRLETE